MRAAVAERLRGEALLRLIRDYAIVVSFAALFIGLALASDVFLTKTNLLNLLEQNAPLGIIALALTFVLITGEFDLSVGAIAMLTGVLAATWADALGVWPALLVAVLCAVGMGVVNGVLVAYARIKLVRLHVGIEPDNRRRQPRDHQRLPQDGGRSGLH